MNRGFAAPSSAGSFEARLSPFREIGRAHSRAFYIYLLFIYIIYIIYLYILRVYACAREAFPGVSF